MPDKKQILYTALSQDEVYKDKVGTQDEFYAKLNDPAKAKMLYTTLSQDEVYRDKVGSEDQFYEKIGLKKKESTTSKSGDGISQSQDEISKQLQQNIQGRPSDFATPKTDYSQKTLDQNIRLAGRQFAAQKQIDNSKQIVKKAKAHAEAANMRASMKFVEIDDAKQAGDENKVNTLIPEYNKELDVIKQSDLDIREAADNYNKAVNENNKINNYFIKQAKLIDTKAKYQEQEEGGNAIINDLGEGTKVLWNSIVPNTISGIGIVTESAGALLDEFRGDPTQYNTLGDYIMQVGQTIHKGGKDLNMSISDDWQKSVFDKEGITDPKAWLNTMISGTGNIISMAALSEIGVPPTVTATVQGADIVYDAAEQAGLSEKERLMMSMTLAPIMGKLDDIGANPYLKEFTAKIFSKGLKETAEKIAAKNITPKMAMEAFGASLSENAGRYIKEVGKDVFKESLTEGAEQAVQITGESIFNIIKGDNAKEGAGKYANRDINAPGYWENTLTEITKSTVEGGIGSLIPVAISAHGISPAKIRLYKDLQDPNPEATKGWYDMLDVALQNEDITPEQHDLFVKQLDFAVRLNKKIPDKIDNPEARAQASDFIQQSEDKKVEIENADEAFKPLLEEEDNQIKADLKKIFETNEPIKTEENDKTYGTRISSEEAIAPEQGNKLTKDEETDALKNQVELAKQYDEYVSSLTEDELIEHYKNIEDETESNDRAESAIDGENKQEPEQPIQRLSREEEKGRDRAGEINAESTILTERVHRAVAQELGINPSDLSKGQIIKEEEKYLEEYAKAKGVWIDDLYEYFGRVPDDYGQENKVYYTEDGKYAVKTNMGVFNESWLDFLDRMALHNYLFPESAYTLEGFGKDNMGNFNAILKQPFIHGTAPTDSEIESFMKENGFERITEDGDKSNDYISQEQGLIVYDLHRGNVIKTDSGKLIVFDPVVALNTEDKGFDGNRKIGGEQTTEPTTQVELSIEEQGNKLEEIFNLERTRDSKKSESVKEDFQKEIDKIAETMPKNLVEKAKFVKLNLNQIRKEMESKNLLKVEC